MGYFKITIKGIFWRASLNGSTKAISVIRTAILARLLSPELFGILGITAIVLALLETFTETGINAYLIQQKVKLKNIIDTAWAISIIRGAIISLVIIVLASPVARFYDSRDAYVPLILISFVPLIRGFINPSIVRLHRDLRFDKDFFLRFGVYAIESIVAVSLVVVYRSINAIIVGMIVGAMVELIASFVYIKPIPKFVFSKAKAKKIISSGVWITLTGVFSYALRQGDDIFVGKLMSTRALGLYQVAYRIAILPITAIGSSFYGVTFPVFVKIKDDRQRLLRAYVKVVISVTLLVLPVGGLIIIFPREMVLIILGDKWLEITSVLRILTIYAVVKSISSTAAPLFLAVKKQEYLASYNFIATVVLFVTIIPFIKMYGLYGAGLSALISWLFALPFIFYYLRLVFTKE